MRALVVMQLTVLAEQQEILAQPVTQVTLALTVPQVQAALAALLATQGPQEAQVTRVTMVPGVLVARAGQLVHQVTLVV